MLHVQIWTQQSISVLKQKLIKMFKCFVFMNVPQFQSVLAYVLKCLALSKRLLVCT